MRGRGEDDRRRCRGVVCLFCAESERRYPTPSRGGDGGVGARLGGESNASMRVLGRKRTGTNILGRDCGGSWETWGEREGRVTRAHGRDVGTKAEGKVGW